MAPRADPGTASGHASTIVSVSGRGSRTCGEIMSSIPQNSRLPTILDSGSPAARRVANSSTLGAAGPSGSSGSDDQFDRRNAGRRGEGYPGLSFRVLDSTSLKGFGQAGERVGASGRSGKSATGRQATWPWQCLYFLPEPHGQGSFRPTRPHVAGFFGSRSATASPEVAA